MKLWEKGIVYQIYPRSFNDSNGYGIEIYKESFKTRLLKRIRVDIIWLSPPYLSPNNDNGYDVADYYKINPNMVLWKIWICLLKRQRKETLELLWI